MNDNPENKQTDGGPAFPIIIYRIQDADGRGPFKPGFSAKWLDPEPKPNEAKLKPWPDEFPEVFFAIRVLRCVYNVGCGCRSPEQLRMWFSSSEIRRLKSFGYQSVKLEADEIMGESEVQVVFRRYLKTLREDVEPFELYAFADAMLAERSKE